jgi:transcriptional regulator with XRE-family HTH domain
MKHQAQIKLSLRQLIDSQGIRAVAVALGISEDYIRKLRRRDRDVSGDVLARACRAYGDTFDATATVREYRSVASK